MDYLIRADGLVSAKCDRIAIFYRLVYWLLIIPLTIADPRSVPACHPRSLFGGQLNVPVTIPWRLPVSRDQHAIVPGGYDLRLLPPHRHPHDKRPVHSARVPDIGRDIGHDDGMRCQLPQRLRETATLRFYSTEIAHSAMASMTLRQQDDYVCLSRIRPRVCVYPPFLLASTEER